MKKILGIFIILSLCGCSSKNQTNNVMNNFKKEVNNSKNYVLKGNLELKNDEETFLYDVEVKYLKPNYYKVEMINNSNNYIQIILKNDDGLYLITPSLNKSFKFESTWPDNSSQVYILSSIIKDIENDENTLVENNNDDTIIKCKVNYPNNNDLKYEKIYIDKNNKLKKIEVYSNSDLVKIELNVKNINYNNKLTEKDFELEEYINTDIKDDSNIKNTISEIETAIYPLYMPANTFLSGSDIISNEENNRVILTFSGDKSFVLVEEPSVIHEELEIIPVYGEPLMFNDTIAALSSNSISWTSSNIDYYILSDNLSVDEMIYVASSLGNSKMTIAPK